MNIIEIETVIRRIKGCTFASLDAETVEKSLRRRTTGERVILFANKNVSGYENMVKRRLLASGKDPDSFHLGELPWGERLSGTPLIHHKGKYYLQTILVSAPSVEYFLGDTRVNPLAFGVKPRVIDGDKVVVQTYNVENIQRLTAMRETLGVRF